MSSSFQNYDLSSFLVGHYISVERNTQVGVTGLLLYGGGNFVQVLEGDDLAVDETIARIRIDPSHHQIYVVSDMAVAQREFSRWQMGFKCVDDSGHSLDFSYQNLISNTVSSSNLTQENSPALKFLRFFYENMP